MDSVRVLLRDVGEYENLLKVDVKVEMIVRHGEIDHITRDRGDIWPLIQHIYVNKPDFEVVAGERYYIVNVVEIDGKKYGTIIESEERLISDGNYEYVGLVTKGERLGSYDVIVPYYVSEGKKILVKCEVGDAIRQDLEDSGYLEEGNILSLQIEGLHQEHGREVSLKKVGERFNSRKNKEYGGVTWY